MPPEFEARLLTGAPLVADGGMGALLQAAIPGLRCPEEANLRAPESVVSLHLGFIRAGADVIETNSFGANRHKLRAIYLEPELTAINEAAVKLAREASGVSFPPVMAIGRLGSLLGDRVIDKLVTPEAIATVVLWGRSPRDPNLPEARKAAQSGAVPASASVHYAYLSPDRFRVALAPNAQSQVAVALVMQRQGLFSWRVVQIEVPLYGRN